MMLLIAATFSNTDCIGELTSVLHMQIHPAILGSSLVGGHVARSPCLSDSASTVGGRIARLRTAEEHEQSAYGRDYYG